MADNVEDLVEPLKRELSGPGDFDDDFPNSDDDTLGFYISDGFSEAQLDGFLGTYTLDLLTGDFDPVLELKDSALVVIYAGLRILRSQLRSLAQSAKYVAGPVSYEVSSSASVIKAELEALLARRDQLIKYNRPSETFFLDAYWSRVFGGSCGSNSWR